MVHPYGNDPYHNDLYHREGEEQTEKSAESQTVQTASGKTEEGVTSGNAGEVKEVKTETAASSNQTTQSGSAPVGQSYSTPNYTGVSWNGYSYSSGNRAASQNGSSSQTAQYSQTPAVQSGYQRTPYSGTAQSQTSYGQTTQSRASYGQTPQGQTSYGQTAQTQTSYSGTGYAQRPSYTWNVPEASQQQANPYYVQTPPKKKKPGKAGKIFVRILAAVLCCCVVSLGSVGIFAAMIQNGVVAIQTPEDSERTAAFTLYKPVENSSNTGTVTTQGTMTPQEVAKKLVPSVVCIQNYQLSQQQGLFLGGYGDSESIQPSPAGEGSGIIISEDGYIVTNQHVVDGATSLRVVTSEGTTYDAELIGEDTQTDLAVLKVDSDDTFEPAEFGDSQSLQVADTVMAIGNPGGLELNSSVTMGHVSALNREVTNSETGYSIDCIQTDAAINPGNSGGALVNLDGYIVGVNSSKIVATGYEGLGFAIPSHIVQPIVSDLIDYGYVKDRAMLGVTGLYVDRWTASYFGLSQGFCIEKATSESAQKAGLTTYDVITAIDDVQVTSSNTISAYIADKHPGDEVTLTVVKARSNETEKVTIALAENTGESD